MQVVYWVFTLRCNDRCEHCYNHSGPRGETVALAELLRVVPHLPATTRQVCLSGGEPTAELGKLEALAGALRARFGPGLELLLQTNGDLLDGAALDRVLAAGVDFVDVVSMDRFHKQQGRQRARLEALFRARGLLDAEAARARGEPRPPGAPAYRFWGADEGYWLGGNWARGRALETGTALRDPGHNFCAMWSGARDFLADGSDQQGVHIQLTRLYPCCPGTYFDLGDVREAPVEALLDAVRADPDWRALDRGRPQELGAASGLDPAEAAARIQALGDVCLWCDEYQRTRFRGPRGAPRPAGQRTPFDV